MRIIAVEEHYVDPTVGLAGRSVMEESLPGFGAAFRHKTGLALAPSFSTIKDLGTGRLEDMDANGIDIQVLSGSSMQVVPAKEAVALAKEANDRLAEVVSANPTRFAGFASLPTADPKAAAVELERVVTKLGFKGATIYGRTNDLFLDDESFSPILEVAETLDVPIYLHPGAPPIAVQESCYGGLDPLVSARLSTAAWGWHLETGIHALHMILSGTFDKYPRLQLILGHWGEMVPYYLERVDTALPPKATNLKQKVSEYFRSNLYITPSGMLSVRMLLFALQTVGADRIMFSMDYPYYPNTGAKAFIEEAPICQADKEKIAFKNAEKLLKL